MNAQEAIQRINRIIRKTWGCSDYSMEDNIALNMAVNALELLKVQEELVRCAECKHLFDGEHTENCCDVLMEKAGWLKEISVSTDWFCADGERR